MVTQCHQEEQEGEGMSLGEEWDGECVAQRGGTRVNPMPDAPRDLGSLPAVTPHSCLCLAVICAALAGSARPNSALCPAKGKQHSHPTVFG